MPRLVAAPDKFRGTATAPEVAAAAGGAARGAGWDADEVPLAAGGEGRLDAVGGEVRVTTVAGPLGEPVAAEWRLVPGPAVPATGGSPGPTAVIEMARAAGRALLPHPSGHDPVRAGTAG
ncbi:MAG: glycerate kinase, partial [Acidimicrobiales bacterium]